MSPSGSGSPTSHSSSTSTLTPSLHRTVQHQKRVQTTPSWARNLPADNFPDEDEGSSPTSASPSGVDSPSSPPPANTPSQITSPLPALLASNSSPISSTPPGSSSNQTGAGVDRWWTFTIPNRYSDRVRDYVNAQKHSHLQASQDEKEKGNAREEEDGSSLAELGSNGVGGGNKWPRDDGNRRRMNGSSVNGDLENGSITEEKRRKDEPHIPPDFFRLQTRLEPPHVHSLNQTLTPGWSAPWAPFHRSYSSQPAHQTPFAFSSSLSAPSKKSRFEHFLLENIFAPLFFRFLNLVANSCSLALACHMRNLELRVGLPGVMGSSTLLTVVVSPLAIVHIFVTLYIEYFGRPIGIWPVRTKMFHTLTELIFISLWSSLLALSLDNLFTTSLSCTSYRPYALYSSSPPLSAGNSGVEGTLADKICGEQVALVVFVFGSLALCVGVLVVSLLRIFAKVSRKH